MREELEKAQEELEAATATRLQVHSAQRVTVLNEVVAISYDGM